MQAGDAARRVLGRHRIPHNLRSDPRTVDAAGAHGPCGAAARSALVARRSVGGAVSHVKIAEVDTPAGFRR